MSASQFAADVEDPSERGAVTRQALGTGLASLHAGHPSSHRWSAGRADLLLPAVPVGTHSSVHIGLGLCWSRDAPRGRPAGCGWPGSSRFLVYYALAIPVALNEMALAVWLMVNGFNLPRRQPLLELPGRMWATSDSHANRCRQCSGAAQTARVVGRQRRTRLARLAAGHVVSRRRRTRRAQTRTRSW